MSYLNCRQGCMQGKQWEGDWARGGAEELTHNAEYAKV